MMLILSVLILLTAMATAAWAWRQWRDNVHTDTAMADVRILRGIDTMILSNLTLEALAQQIVDLIPSTNRAIGATLRVARPDGAVEVLAVSQSLDSPDSAHTLHQLAGSTLSPGEIARGGSKLAQALNQKQIVTGTELSEFEAPTLDATAAAEIQSHFEIKGIVTYPVLVDEVLTGALTFYFDRGPATITSHDHDLMQGITNEVGIAIGNSRLGSQVEEINRKLSEANSHLTELDAMKDDFIAVASHQLRSPLTAVKGYLSMLSDGDYGEVPEKQRVVVDQLVRSTNEVINLVNDMLSVSRMNAQKFELVTQPTALSEIIRDVVAELSPLAADKGLELDVQIPDPEPATILVDPLRIRQVVLNLIDNAIKYTTTGSVKVALTSTDEAVTFSVADTGIGIPENEQSKLFGKFYRAKNARSRIVNGSGLGLYVAKEIVTKHGGELTFQSSEGKGTVFTATLPRTARPVTSPPAAAISVA
jgi:signal transduction histidine kinase